MSVRIRSHWAVALTPVLFLPITMESGAGLREALRDAVCIALLIQFFSILPHELGHVLSSRMFGVRGGTLFLGGVLGGWLPDDDNWPDRLTPGKRIAVYASGPAINLLVAALCTVLPIVSDQSPSRASSLCIAIAEINLFVAILNLLPVFPLDGGRILRDFLAMAGLSPLQNLACVRLAAIVAGLAWLLAILRYGNWTDWFSWILAMTIAAYLLRDKSWYMEGLETVAVRHRWGLRSSTPACRLAKAPRRGQRCYYITWPEASRTGIPVKQ